MKKNLEGLKAPAFTLQGNDGKQHSLEDNRGQTVILYFYPTAMWLDTGRR